MTTSTVSLKIRVQAIITGSTSIDLDPESQRSPATGKLDFVPFTFKAGVFTVRQGFYHTMGRSDADVADDIFKALKAAGLKMTTINLRQVRRNWPKGSYWEVTFSVAEMEPEPGWVDTFAQPEPVAEQPAQPEAAAPAPDASLRAIDSALDVAEALGTQADVDALQAQRKTIVAGLAAPAPDASADDTFTGIFISPAAAQASQRDSENWLTEQELVAEIKAEAAALRRTYQLLAFAESHGTAADVARLEEDAAASAERLTELRRFRANVRPSATPAFPRKMAIEQAGDLFERVSERLEVLNERVTQAQMAGESTVPLRVAIAQQTAQARNLAAEWMPH